ncbi:MAG: YlmC/YmxH family sporulation protein [Ruminococcus sp.]
MVNLRFFELRQKEVINICTCKSLGCPVDLEFECKTGRILALIIPGPGKFWGMLGRDCEYVIPWECVVQIGDDIILVEIKEDMCLKKFS